MQLRMWMLDVAREQCPTLDHLRRYATMTLDSGYNALGLYLEHRYAYPSAPWAHGTGCLTPEMVRTLQKEFPGLTFIPFINLLGHMEGMLYTEEGKRYREQLFQGMQACPSKPEFVDFCGALIADTLEAFDSEIVHIGGDETWQLGACETCKTRVTDAESQGKPDGKAELYGAHFGPLAQRVLEAGRRPAVWGDMFLDHPTALEFLPKQSLVFDWQYFGGLAKSTPTFTQKGFEVVGCPTLHVYNATWLHLKQSEDNVRAVTKDVQEMGLHGGCVTTWESGLFGAYDTLLPALRACGGILRGEDSSLLAAYAAESPHAEEWARLMSDELALCGGPFAYSGTRSSLKVRLLLNGNPFLAWLHHGEVLSGEVGDSALEVIERALQAAPGEAEKGVCVFARGAIEFVRIAEQARKLYAAHQPEAAVSKLAATRLVFDELEKVARRSHERIGGSLADVERCRFAREHVERVIGRIRSYGKRELGYLPAFEVITHHKFMPHDQACWWLINRWANE